jgi:hypothetical protein
MSVTWNDPIKSYFSPYDVSHMKQVQPQLNLADYQSTKDNAVLVYQWVSTKRMPPGNPWPDAQIAIYKEWIEAGCPEQ